MNQKDDEHTYKAVSLFSGAGGMDIGIKQAGFEILASVEMDPYACETLRANISRELGKTQVFEEDIRKIAPARMMNELGLEVGQLDLLFGGPPCQAFSQIGKRHSLNDDRGLLLFEMVRFAEAFRPKVLLIEQVKGLLNAPDNDDKPGGVFEQLIDRLEELGYTLKWKVVNAAEYGVPQLRQRVFMVAVRDGEPFFFPAATHGDPKKQGLIFALPSYRTVGDVISDMEAPYPLNGFIPQDSHLDVTPRGDRFRINGVPEGLHLSGQLHLPQEQRGNLSKKDTTKFKRLSRLAPSNTLRCGEIFFHPLEDRYLTPREYMRIHGYPDEYILRGPIRGRSGRVRFLDQHRQIANSVPPPVANVLGRAILSMLHQPLYA